MANKYKWDTGDKPQIDNIWSGNDTLGVKIERMFIRFMQRVFIWSIDFLSDRLVDVFDNSMKILRPGMERATKGMFPHLKQIKGMPSFFYEMLDAVEKETGETSFFTKLIVMYASVRGIIFGGLQPYSDLANQWALNNIRTALPDASQAAQFWRVGLLRDDRLKDIMGGLGVPDGIQEMYKELSRNMLNVGDIIQGRWRGVIPDQRFRDLLHRLGYTDEDAKVIDELSNQIPPLNDLIHMLVREAFNDSTSAKFGYDDDYPQDINPYFEKQGYNADWAKRYWRAHWTLPSPTQAYEMLHRGLITQQDLSDLLKTADYPSFWRDRLMAVSYNVLTRVDVRRLLQAGLIDEAKARQTYNEMGYRPEDADLLTKFAIQGISNDEKDLTRTDIIGAYVDGLTDRGTAAAALVKMGYDGQEAEQLLQRADYDIAKAERTDKINYVKERLQAGVISRVQASAELSQAGLKAVAVDRYLLAWDRVSLSDVKNPTLADLRKLWMDEVITEDDFRAQLKLAKYNDKVIEWFVLQVKKDQEAAGGGA